MNTELKKEEKHINHQEKYMERHQTLCVTLDKKNDADIIEWLDKQENRSQAVRELIKGVIHEKGNEPKDTVSDGDQKVGNSEEDNDFEIFEI